MKKKLIIIFSCIFAGIAIFSYLTRLPDITSFIVRLAGNYDLKKNGIQLKYGYVSPGMRDKPFIFPFRGSISKFSRGAINLDIINSYTVGNYQKDSPDSIGSVNNFLDPKSKFKDSWFGVFLIMDDKQVKGKNFILLDPGGDPADMDNFNIESLLELPRIDQMVVVHTTHQKEQGYDFYQFLRSFPFKKIAGTGPEIETIKDRDNRTWLKIISAYETVSGLTDTSITDMDLLMSIRAFVGLPDKKVYEYVDPWHPIIIRGALLARYFQCEKQNFWAVVYYNGTFFMTKKGDVIDTWKDTDIQQEFKKMFMDLRIGCLK